MNKNKQTEPTSERNGDLLWSQTLSTTSHTPEEVADRTIKELKKYGLSATEKVSVTDPITGVTKEITLDRTGYGENKLIVALANPDLNRDQKDHMLSMYLFERGKDSASFLVDLMRYKGQNTKETRAFKSQMRFDFELFVSQFSKFIRDQSKLIGICLDMDIFKAREGYTNWLEIKRKHNKDTDFSYFDYALEKTQRTVGKLNHSDRMYIAMVGMAIQSLDEGEKIVAQIQNITKSRERDMGKGIYVNYKGEVYSHDDPELDDIIKADRERQSELNKE